MGGNHLERERTTFHREEDRPRQLVETEPLRRDVLLGARFPLFPVGATSRQGHEGDRTLRVRSLVLLHSNDLLPPLPFLFETLAWRTAPHEAFTPFDPAAGYTVTSDDYDPATRRLRRRQLRHEGAQAAIPDHPLILAAFCQAGHPQWRQGTAGTPRIEELLGSWGEHLAHLQLQVTANGLSFVADPYVDALKKNGELAYWSDFYPQDRGPLPTAGRSYPATGLFIALPARWDALTKLQGAFRLPGPVTSPVPSAS